MASWQLAPQARTTLTPAVTSALMPEAGSVMDDARTLSDRLVPLRTRLLLASVPIAAYVLIFFLIFFASSVGASAIDLAAVAVAVTAWLLGRLGGTIAGLLAAPVNFALLWLAGLSAAEAMGYASNGASCSANIAIGWAAGW